VAEMNNRIKIEYIKLLKSKEEDKSKKQNFSRKDG